MDEQWTLSGEFQQFIQERVARDVRCLTAIRQLGERYLFLSEIDHGPKGRATDVLTLTKEDLILGQRCAILLIGEAAHSFKKNTKIPISVEHPLLYDFGRLRDIYAHPAPFFHLSNQQQRWLRREKNLFRGIRRDMHPYIEWFNNHPYQRFDPNSPFAFMGLGAKLFSIMEKMREDFPEDAIVLTHPRIESLALQHGMNGEIDPENELSDSVASIYDAQNMIYDCCKRGFIITIADIASSMSLFAKTGASALILPQEIKQLRKARNQAAHFADLLGDSPSHMIENEAKITYETRAILQRAPSPETAENNLNNQYTRQIMAEAAHVPAKMAVMDRAVIWSEQQAKLDYPKHRRPRALFQEAFILGVGRLLQQRSAQEVDAFLTALQEHPQSILYPSRKTGPRSPMLQAFAQSLASSMPAQARTR